MAASAVINALSASADKGRDYIGLIAPVQPPPRGPSIRGVQLAESPHAMPRPVDLLVNSASTPLHLPRCEQR
jgi:hypothetical protein